MVVVRPGLVYGPGWGGMAGTLRRLASFPCSPIRPESRPFTVSENDLPLQRWGLATAGQRRPTRWGSPIRTRQLPDTADHFAAVGARGTTAVRAHATHGRLWRPPGGGAHEAEPAGAADSLLGLIRPARACRISR